MQIDKFYQSQAQAHSKHIFKDPELTRLSETWFADNTTDAWRHQRMRSSISPIIVPGERWITFGDGRYGTDAAWLIRQGLQVICTDIQDDLLKISNARGFIGDYSQANAEALCFADEQFDWALCKEAYHHMPRAPVAFYEMLRVVKKGLVLIEPTPLQAKNAFGELTLAALAMVRAPRPQFEESGNYVYTLAIAEVKQMLLGIGKRHFAFKGLADHYIAGVEYEIAPGPLMMALQRKMRIKSFVRRCLGLHDNLGVYVIFKQETEHLEDLKRAGFTLFNLPENPYLSR